MGSGAEILRWENSEGGEKKKGPREPLGSYSLGEGVGDAPRRPFQKFIIEGIPTQTAFCDVFFGLSCFSGRCTIQTIPILRQYSPISGTANAH